MRILCVYYFFHIGLHHISNYFWEEGKIMGHFQPHTIEPFK